jgi:hypothetical protein
MEFLIPLFWFPTLQKSNLAREEEAGKPHPSQFPSHLFIGGGSQGDGESDYNLRSSGEIF